MAKGRRQADKHGYVVIDKPAGWTSHDVFVRVRRILGERRVGHAGTLDPAATGVLPVAVGLATRTVEFLATSSKAYRADITFGVETDSGDAEGSVTRSVDASHLTSREVEALLQSFLGPQRQVPPMHSAVKVGGTRLYNLARGGQEIDVPARDITIHALHPVEWQSPTLTLDVTCSKGTYIRSLARDIGRRAGTGAFLSHLIRTRTGPFTLRDAVSLDDLVLLYEKRGWSGLAFHPDWVLQELTAVVLDDEAAHSWRLGQTVRHDPVVRGSVRVYDAEGAWLGIGEASGEAIRPTKVILTE